MKLDVGKGRVELTGVVKKDANSSYDLKAKNVDFNRLLLQQQSIPPKPAPVKKGATKKPTAPARVIEARGKGTLAATGQLAPALTTRATFKITDSMYDNLPLTGEGTVRVAGMRLLPSKAALRATTSIGAATLARPATGCASRSTRPRSNDSASASRARRRRTAI